jgi:hypothetical protein
MARPADDGRINQCVDDSLSLELTVLEQKLNALAQVRVKAAMSVEVCRLIGLSRPETEQRLDLTRAQYTEACRDLRTVLRRTGV